MSSIRCVQLFVLMCLLTSTAGCRTNEVHLDERDRFTPGARASYEFYPGVDRRRSGSLVELATRSREPDLEDEITAKSSRIRGTIALDGAFDRVKARDRQHVPSGTGVQIGLEIPGPEIVKVNAKNLRGHLAARGGVRFYDVLSLEGIIGAAIDRTEVRLRGGGIVTREESVRPGFLVGFRGTVRPIPLFDLYLQYTRSFASLDTESTNLQAGIDLNITRNVAIYAGYQRWNYDQRDYRGGSHIDLDVRGPTSGVSLKF